MTLSKFNWLLVSQVKIQTIGFVVLAFGWFPATLMAQPKTKFTVVPVKLDDKSKSAKEKEKNAELKGDKVDLTAMSEFYTGFVIPKLSEAVPTELNARRRELESDIEIVGKNKNKAVLLAYNKKAYELLSTFAKNKSYDPTARITSMIVMTQLVREPAGRNPPVPDPDVLKDLYLVLDPKKLSDPKERELDAMIYIAIKSLERYLRAQPANPADGFSDKLRKAFVTRIAEIMTVNPPVPRLLDGHQKLMEQALVTMTLFATKSTGDTQKSASEAVTKFVMAVFNDQRSSEWLKEVSCACLGQITPSALTPEEVTKLENEIAKFAIKSLYDWRLKVAMSGSLGMGGGGLMGGYGGGSGEMGGMGMMGGEGSGGEGSGGDGYGMGGGMGGQPKANVTLPPEVRNAKRMIHQRLERIHLALNGSARKYPDSSPLAKSTPKGLITLVAEDEKFKVQDAIEKLDKLQLDVNSNVVDLTALSNAVRLNLRDFRLACVEISGEAKEKAENDALNPFSNAGSSE